VTPSPLLLAQPSAWQVAGDNSRSDSECAGVEAATAVAMAAPAEVGDAAAPSLTRPLVASNAVVQPAAFLGAGSPAAARGRDLHDPPCSWRSS